MRKQVLKESDLLHVTDDGYYIIDAKKDGFKKGFCVYAPGLVSASRIGVFTATINGNSSFDMAKDHISYHRSKYGK